MTLQEQMMQSALAEKTAVDAGSVIGKDTIFSLNSTAVVDIASIVKKPKELDSVETSISHDSISTVVGKSLVQEID